MIYYGYGSGSYLWKSPVPAPVLLPALVPVPVQYPFLLSTVFKQQKVCTNLAFAMLKVTLFRFRNRNRDWFRNRNTLRFRFQLRQGKKLWSCGSGSGSGSGFTALLYRTVRLQFRNLCLICKKN